MKLELLYEFVKKQGFSIFLLAIGIYWFDNQHTKLQKEIDILNIYIRNEFKSVLEKNTTVLTEVSKKLEK